MTSSGCRDADEVMTSSPDFVLVLVPLEGGTRDEVEVPRPVPLRTRSDEVGRGQRPLPPHLRPRALTTPQQVDGTEPPAA